MGSRTLVTGSRLPLNLMTLDDLECKNKDFRMDFFGDFGLKDTFQ